MKADPTYTHKEFGTVKQGDLVIAVLQQAGGVRRAVYGIKSSMIVNGREEEDYFVALDNEKPPTAYHHQALRGRVLQPKQSFQITPILEPDYILPELPRNFDRAGIMFLLEDSMLLGVAQIGNDQGPAVTFFNFEDSKLIVHPITNIAIPEKILMTRGWQLLAQDSEGEQRIVIEFKARNPASE